MRLWVKDPLAVLGEGGEGGVVVEGTRIVELVGRGAAPKAPPDEVFDAGASCAAARPRQRAPSFLSDAGAGASGRASARSRAVARRALSDLVAHGRARPAARRAGGAGRIAAVRLHDGGRSSQSVPAGPRSRHRHRGRRGPRARRAHDGHARRHELFDEGRRTAAGKRRPSGRRRARGLRARGQGLS